MMKRKILALLLIMGIVLLVLTGCTGSTNDNITAERPHISDSEIDALFAASIDCPELVPQSAPKEPICADFVNSGLLRICYKGEPDTKYKLQVLKDDNTIYYNLFADGRIEDFSLQFGSGEYTVRIMQNIKDDEYFAAEDKTINVSLSDENAVYLHSIQNVDWDYEKLPIEDVRYIISSSLVSAQDGELLPACTDDLYRYVTEHIEYDNSKIDDLPYNYLPDIEKTYIEETGICYDYASLLAAMLRSAGIPAKLVKGYASYNPNVYHAWNEVYVDGKWIILDATRDAALFGAANPTEAAKAADEYSKVSEY